MVASKQGSGSSREQSMQLPNPRNPRKVLMPHVPGREIISPGKLTLEPGIKKELKKLSKGGRKK